jgi:ankyrin repeat protein
MQQCGTECSSITINHLPFHLQHLIFASAAAPLTTCKASAAITSDAGLTAQWLQAKSNQPLLKAVKHQLWDVCDKLLGTHKYTPGTEELCNALERVALYGCTHIVSSLLQWCCKEHHQQCDVCDSLRCALFNATRKGHVPLVSLLAQHPAIEAQGARCAVCLAAMHGHLEVLQALITTRPDASNPELTGSPMCDAAQWGQVAAMQLLVQHGADVHNSRGQPWSSVDTGMPLEGAALYGFLEVVKWLHEQGMTEDDMGQALYAAVYGGHVPIIHFLLQECSVDVSLYGPNALRVALERGHLEVVCLLLQAGTPTNDVAAFTHAARHFKPEQLGTILQVATQHGHTQFVAMLKELRAAAK